ncbi:MAG: hypothetical protein MN733_37980, partial [Nitrososphaera sp.]|nr:hypothetical protein [Nitrososphaera sp.]
MRYILMAEVIGYLGMILIQGVWYQRGQLSENKFAVFQTTYFSLFILTSFLYYSSFEYVLTGAILSILYWVIG